MRSLVWFRSDLRTTDNAALHAACAAAPARGVVALFVVSPGEWRAHDVAPVRLDLVRRSLVELSAALAKLHIPLLLATAASAADIPAAVLAVARAHACTDLFFNREHEVDERRRDAATIALFQREGLNAKSFNDQCIVEPGAIRTGGDTYYTVFSPFKRAFYRHLSERGPLTPLPAPKPQATTGIHPDPIPPAFEGFESMIDPALWPAGERVAQARLAGFLAHDVAAYKEARDVPALAGTSGLAAYLAVGNISPRQCVAAAVAANPSGTYDAGPPGVVHWISEVAWREFYVHILIGFPRVSMGRAFQPATERIRWNDAPAHFDAWCRGRTGIPLVDAGMRQLVATGFMHNRIRMITAMFLSKNLFLDWRLGERFFMQRLACGFLASNNGGWQWSASTGTDAAPYFRIMNPVSQSEKFDPRGDYIRRWVPELENVEGPAIHQPWTLPRLLRDRLEYPAPIVDLSASRAAAIDAFRRLKDSSSHPYQASP